MGFCSSNNNIQDERVPQFSIATLPRLYYIYIYHTPIPHAYYIHLII